MNGQSLLKLIPVFLVWALATFGDGEPEPTAVLFVGNSISYVGNLPQVVENPRIKTEIG